jgi:deazaflavin-dependent oxidoreductase (nitroreductase family)
MRIDKQRISTLVARFGLNPLVRLLFRLGVPVPGVVLLETLGRRTGRTRQVPVTGRLRDGAVWLSSEHGERAGYVRNIGANPRVRVKVGRRWHAGTAHVLDRSELDRVGQLAIGRLARPLYRPTLRIVGTDPVPIRIDLDP